jgi:hypothetical protein
MNGEHLYDKKTIGLSLRLPASGGSHILAGHGTIQVQKNSGLPPFARNDSRSLCFWISYLEFIWSAGWRIGILNLVLQETPYPIHTYDGK